MAHSFIKIFVPALGTGVQVPTLPIGAGISDEAVNICHATNDVTPELATIQPLPVNPAPAPGVIFKPSPGAFLRCSALIGATSGYLVLLDNALGISGNNVALTSVVDALWIESNGTAGFGVLEYRRGLRCLSGCSAVFTINTNPLIYTQPPTGSLALFFAQTV